MPVMVLCGAISLLLWLGLTLRQPTAATMEMPVVVTSLPRGQALATPVPRTVNVVLEGTGYRLLPLFSSPPVLPIAATQRDVQLDAQLPALPVGVRLVGVTPRLLRLDTDSSVTRRVPVVVRSMLSFVPSYALSGPMRVLPESVEVTGAHSIVRRLAGWPTETAMLPTLRDTVRIDLALVDTLGGLVSRSATSARVTFPVAAFSGQTRALDIRVGRDPDTHERYTFDPPVVEARFRVRLGQGAAALASPEFYATVSADDVRRSTNGLVRVRAAVPPGLGVQPESVVLTPEVVRVYRVVRD